MNGAMNEATIRSTRRGFIGGAAGAMALGASSALAVPLGGLTWPGSGHVAFAGDFAWWDPQGQGDRSRFPLLPASDPLSDEVLDWLI